MKPDKKVRIQAISDRIEGFCRSCLNDEYETFAKGLLARIAYLPQLNLQRGRPEIWAAAIVTVIARLNFLFDPAGPDATSMEAICDFFGTVRSTTGNKATAIEKACDIRMGEPGLCREEITDSLTFVETDEGFLVPKRMLGGSGGVRSEGNRSAASTPPLKRVDEKESIDNKPSNNLPNKPAKPKKKKGADNDKQMRLFDDF